MPCRSLLWSRLPRTKFIRTSRRASTAYRAGLALWSLGGLRPAGCRTYVKSMASLQPAAWAPAGGREAGWEERGGRHSEVSTLGPNILAWGRNSEGFVLSVSSSGALMKYADQCKGECKQCKGEAFTLCALFLFILLLSSSSAPPLLFFVFKTGFHCVALELF